MKPGDRNWQRLDEFLLKLPDDDEPLLVEQLEGFLATLLVCPELIPPSRWLPYVWSTDGGGDHAPAFKTLEQAQEILGLIMARYNDIALSLLDEENGYEPIFAVDPADDVALWELWVSGFSRAAGLALDSWDAIAESDDEDAVLALAGIMALDLIERGDSDLSADKIEKLKRSAPELIGIWVNELARWRLASARVTPAAPARSSRAPPDERVGRNAPCPCGSGKKYKRCHGAS